MKTPIFAALVAVLLGGCAATPVTQQTPRDYDGFSVVPPQEPGWFVNCTNESRPKDGCAVVFQKKTDSDTHKMLVGVERSLAPKIFVSKEEFLQHVNDSYLVVDPHFYEFIFKEATLNAKHGEYCVDYRYKYKDFTSPRPKSASFLLHEGHCFVCLHPTAKDREYDVCYSETFAPGEEDSQFRVAGEAFIDNIRFTEPSSANPGARNLLTISAELQDNKNRVFFLSQFPYNPLYPVRIMLDGVKIASISSGEIATVKMPPGPHTVKCSFSLTGAEKSFEMTQDAAKYFLIREYLPQRGKLTWGKSGPEILEVPEADWRYIAEDPAGRIYRGQ